MWTRLSASCRICLLALAILMLFSASQVDSVSIGLPCCHKGQSRPVDDIQRCFEQTPRQDCTNHAFVIITSSNQKICVRATPPWLKRLVNAGEMNCPSVLLNKGRFEDLDEDEME